MYEHASETEGKMMVAAVLSRLCSLRAAGDRWLKIIPDSTGTVLGPDSMHLAKRVQS